jgi:hypothetical protein
MADTGTDGFYADKDGIGVTVDAQVENFENVAAGFALLPELVAGTAEEDDFAGALGERESFGVHETEHEDPTGAAVLDDGGD